eukprot:TRINITY_DN649_c0_g1_i3.p1 TRINITY_DN649_c0_g1~~TRINITY_DN649_c0_g1_i3.p1  ORF type:complete len:449 (+),score=64.82 TRINITY_DN649_c0_g1_i3:251-1597(+)
MALVIRATRTPVIPTAGAGPGWRWRQSHPETIWVGAHSALLHQSLRQQQVSWHSSCLPLLLTKSPRCKAADTDKKASDLHDEKETAKISTRDAEDLPNSSQSWLPVLPHVLTAAMANFMFGYHIGIINGPLDSMARELGFGNDNILQGLVVSIFLLGAFAGSIGGGILSDKIGRRRTFQVDAVPLILGSAISATATSVEGLLVGRLMVGLGIGVNTSLVPLYISEVAPTQYRGALASFCQVGTCVGIIAVLLIGVPVETDPHWWRTMFWIGTIPAALLIGGMELAAESPRWLVKVGRLDDARVTVEKLWGTSQVSAVMEELTAGQSGPQDEASWSELVSEKYLKVVMIGGSLFALQQFAGINGILYFSSLNFQNAGIPNGMVASAAVGVSNLIGSFVALSLMDNQGRQKLLQVSYLGMATSIAVLVLAREVPMAALYSHTFSIGGTLA